MNKLKFLVLMLLPLLYCNSYASDNSNAFPLQYEESFQYQSASKEELIPHTQDFTSVISVNKTEFFEGEPIWVTIKIKNIGYSRDSLPMLNEDFLTRSLNVMDQNGKIKTYLFEGEAEYLWKSYRIFEPGEEYTLDIELLQSYGDQYEGHKFMLASGCFSEGTYSVESNFKDVKTLLLRSNKINFVVVKPTGLELEALNTLRSIYQMRDYSDAEIIDKERAYREFYTKYGGSVYTESSLYYYSAIITVTGIGYSEAMIGESLAFIEYNPNSSYVGYYIWLGQKAVEKLRNGKASEIDFLTEVKQKFPDTRAYQEASKFLKDLNR